MWLVVSVMRPCAIIIGRCRPPTIFVGGGPASFYMFAAPPRAELGGPEVSRRPKLQICNDPRDVYMWLVVSVMRTCAIIRALQGPQLCSFGAGQSVFTCSAPPRAELRVLGCPGDQNHKFDPRDVYMYVASGECYIMRSCAIIGH